MKPGIRSGGHRLSWEDPDRRSRGPLSFLHATPYEPLVSREEVLEIPCPSCGAETGIPCSTAFPRPSLAGLVFTGFRDVHLIRYQARTHDLR
jgi:hypothetical protein